MRVLVFCITYSVVFMLHGESSSVRDYWVQSMCKIATPVLQSLSQDCLRKEMPIRTTPLIQRDRSLTSPFEAFTRTMVGIAPWLELGPDTTSEGRLRQKYLDWALQAISVIVNPQSKDYMDFDCDRQGLVDAAFLAEAFLRAPQQLWEPLDAATRELLLTEMRSTRSIKPLESNWLLFSAMIETFLYKFTGRCQPEVISYAFGRFQEWYKGDSFYGDGPQFHFDYYNSFVIQPMMLDILLILRNCPKSLEIGTQGAEEVYRARFERHVEILERLISPEGYYPVVGRSIVYRYGAFHHLSRMAGVDMLPSRIYPAQVREALTAVLKQHHKHRDMFDAKGWLHLGFSGLQPELAESYISTGSLYLCATVYAVLGLPLEAPFWSSPAKAWSSQSAWNGEKIYPDKASKN